jgi:glycosyltransferase involved in cell wall biosynthesis
MKIVNAMFSKNLGGIEQAFIDYTKALIIENHQVLCLTQKNAKINAEVEKLLNDTKYKKNLSHQKISNFGKWDLIAKYKIYKACKNFTPDFLLAQGNRPTQLFSWAKNCLKIKLISVSHNYKIKPLLKADFIFSITEDLKNFISSGGFDKNKIAVIPNMIEFDKQAVNFTTYQSPPVIGVMARFVKKKGIDDFLKACFALKNKNINFKAIIAGDGEEKENIQKLRDELNLEQEVTFIGWAKNRFTDFYEKIDIFCLPSKHEPFGIVLLEAMLQGKPIVSTDSEGPLEIIENGVDGYLAKKENAGDIAIQLEKMINNQAVAKEFVIKGFEKLKNNYHIKSVAKMISENLQQV